jgi:hypothetical protein
MGWRDAGLLLGVAMLAASGACSLYDGELLPLKPTAAAGAPARPAEPSDAAAPMPVADSAPPRDTPADRVPRDAGAPDPIEDSGRPDEPDADEDDAGCDSRGPDGDRDGVADCADGCPTDPAKREPGGCGCGLVERDEPEAASCNGLREQILHRYTFDGRGSVARDAYGMADGVLIGVELSGKGNIELNLGSEGQYVNLPAGIVSRLNDATFEAWVTSDGGRGHVFDFGEPGLVLGLLRSSLYLSLESASDRGPQLGYISGLTSITIDAPAALAPHKVSQLAVVVDSGAERIALYVNGKLIGESKLRASLSSFEDAKNWLGRAQNAADPDFSGVLYDFRIYAAPLRPDQIATSFRSGPDPAFLKR